MWGETRAAKNKMSNDELCSYFKEDLQECVDCGNKSCDCLCILTNAWICHAVALYLIGIERKTKDVVVVLPTGDVFGVDGCKHM